LAAGVSRSCTLLALAALAGASPGCSPVGESTAPGASPVVATTPSADRSQSARDPEQLQRAIDAARNDLAVRLGVAMDSVTVQQATPVTWRSGAIGCPEPGVFYTQALVAGYRIVLRADSQSYTFHAKHDGKPFLCPQERAEAPLDEQPPH
jgi:hypothetical protein